MSPYPDRQLDIPTCLAGVAERSLPFFLATTPLCHYKEFRTLVWQFPDTAQNFPNNHRGGCPHPPAKNLSNTIKSVRAASLPPLHTSNDFFADDQDYYLETLDYRNDDSIKY